MKSKISLFMAVILIALAAVQCRKKKSEEPPAEEPTPVTTTGPNSVADIIAANGSALNTVTLDVSLATTLTINGNIFEIPANAFQTSTGGTVGGIVSLSVKTIMTKSQIILTGAGANSSNSKLVATKGCIKTTASQSTQTLRLVPAANFIVNVKDVNASSSPMKKFYAPKVTVDDSTKYWALGTDISDIPQTTFTASANVFHKATLDSLKWLNVGVQDTSAVAPKTAVSVSVTASMFNKGNTMMYLSYDGSLTVGALFELTPSGGIFRISNVPQGRVCHIIGISAINGQYYCASMIYVVPAPGAPTVNLNLVPVSQSQMIATVNALP